MFKIDVWNQDPRDRFDLEYHDSIIERDKSNIPKKETVLHNLARTLNDAGILDVLLEEASYQSKSPGLFRVV